MRQIDIFYIFDTFEPARQQRWKSFRISKKIFSFICVLALLAGLIPTISAYEAHVINITARICNYSEIRSVGFWKNHSYIYSHYLPQALGDETIDTVQKAKQVFSDYSLSMRHKLKGQLLAMKFNLAHFGIGEYLVEGEGKTLNEIVAEADALLLQDPPPPDSVLEEMKDLLDHLNNLSQLRFCSAAPPDNECRLQLAKTVLSDEVNPGDEITYHLTLDNIGNEICTGSGVLLKDTFGNKLKYIDYTSTRRPDSFSKSTNYIQWNFGNIHPDDQLIEIDLEMKVRDSAQCDSKITNLANYWSKETDWGEPVTAENQVVCPPPLEAGIVINEFLPNPVGHDNAPKPNGEWVELYNTGNEIDVAGWVLYDANDTHELLITSDNTHTSSTIIGSGEFLVVYRNGDNDFALNNTGGDTVRLYDGAIGDGANLIDSYTYTINALEGKSFARIPDGSENWVDPVPTPGQPNIVEDENAVFGAAVSEQDEQLEEQDDEEEFLPEEITGNPEEPAERLPQQAPSNDEPTAQEPPAEEPTPEEDQDETLPNPETGPALPVAPGELIQIVDDEEPETAFSTEPLIVDEPETEPEQPAEEAAAQEESGEEEPAPASEPEPEPEPEPPAAPAEESPTE